MANFKCEYCGETILDTEVGYLIGCEHYPIELKMAYTKDEMIRFRKQMSNIKTEIENWRVDHEKCTV